MPNTSTESTRTPVERAFYESFIIGNRWSVTRLYAQNMSASRHFKNELRHLAYQRRANLHHMDKEMDAARRELDHIQRGEDELLYLPTEEEKQLLNDVQGNMPQVKKQRRRGIRRKYTHAARDPLAVRSRAGSRIREISRLERGYLGMVHLHLHQRRRGSSKAYSLMHPGDGAAVEEGEEDLVTNGLSEGEKGVMLGLDSAMNLSDAVKHLKLNQIDDYYKEKITKLGKNLTSANEEARDLTDGRRQSVTTSQDRAKTPRSRSSSSASKRKPSLMYDTKRSAELPSNAYNAILTQSRNKFLALDEADQNSGWVLNDHDNYARDEITYDRLNQPSIGSMIFITDRVAPPAEITKNEEQDKIKVNNHVTPTLSNEESISADVESRLELPRRTLDLIPEDLPVIEEEENIAEVGTVGHTAIKESSSPYGNGGLPSNGSPQFPSISPNISSGRRVSFSQNTVRKTSSAPRKISRTPHHSTTEYCAENSSNRKVSSATPIARKISSPAAPLRKTSSAGSRKKSSIVSLDQFPTTNNDTWDDDPGWEEHNTKPANQSPPSITSPPTNQQVAQEVVPQKRPSRISLDSSASRKNGLASLKLGQDRQRSKSLFSNSSQPLYKRHSDSSTDGNPNGELPQLFNTLARRHTDGTDVRTASMGRKHSSSLPPISKSSYDNFYNERDLQDTTAKYISRYMKVDVTKLNTPLST